MTEPQLAVVEMERPDSWRAALQRALRAEFLVSPLVAPADSPLLPWCGVEGCCRPAARAPWGGFETRLCRTHYRRWEAAGTPLKEEWLAKQPPRSAVELLRPCAVLGCRRSAASAGMCFSHANRWRKAGGPELATFTSSAAPAATGEAPCQVAGCGFPACAGGRRPGLCDAHAARYSSWLSFRRTLGDRDDSVEHYLARIARRDASSAGLALPEASLLALELPVRCCSIAMTRARGSSARASGARWSTR